MFNNSIMYIGFEVLIIIFIIVFIIIGIIKRLENDKKINLNFTEYKKETTNIEINLKEKKYFSDLFKEREVFGNTLIKFIQSIKPIDIDDPSNPEETEDTRVISIDADWGFGKTYFMNALKNELEKEDYIVLTFNAWTNDFETEPLIPLVQEITSQIINNVHNSKIKDSLEKTGIYLLATVNELIRLTSKVKISIGNGASTIELPEIDIINDSIDRIENNVGKINENNNIKKTLNTKSDLAEMIIYFKSKLIEIYDEINKSSKSSKKIIILIDELDRCKPTFAIELLERVKHFFDTGKYLFIFTINSKQLKLSVNQFYGNCFDQSGYFRRFFDYELYLPNPNAQEYLDKNKVKLELEFKNNIELVQTVHETIPKDLSLRTYEKLDKLLKTILILSKDEKLEPNEIMFLNIGIIIKFLDSKLFKDVYLDKTSNPKLNNEESSYPLKFTTSRGAHDGDHDRDLKQGLKIIPSISSCQNFQLSNATYINTFGFKTKNLKHSLFFNCYSIKDDTATIKYYILKNITKNRNALDKNFNVDRLMTYLIFSSEANNEGKNKNNNNN